MLSVAIKRTKANSGTLLARGERSDVVAGQACLLSDNIPGPNINCMIEGAWRSRRCKDSEGCQSLPK